MEEFKHLQKVLPAMGYSPEQLKELEAVINKCDCDVVVSGTPIDLTRIIKTNRSDPDFWLLMSAAVESSKERIF